MRKKVFAVILIFCMVITCMLPNSIVKAESSIIETGNKFIKTQYLGEEYVITNPRLVFDNAQTYFYADIENLTDRYLESVTINILFYNSKGELVQTLHGVLSRLYEGEKLTPAINAGITEDWRNEDISSYRIEIRGTGEMSRTEKEEITIEDDVMYYDNHKYQYFEGGISWYDAKARCEEKGGHLLVISSRNEQEYINEYVTSLRERGYLTKQNIWLGATIENHVIDWVVDEGRKFTNWAQGEPNNVYNMQDCVMMYTTLSVNGKLGYWNDENGNGRNWTGFTLNDTGYICEWGEEIDEEPIESDTEIIEKVELYTSNGGGEYARKLNEIIKKLEDNNVSQAEILNLLNQFFVERGYANIEEGIEYLYDATNAKMAYDYLINNDVYCSYQYAKYLNATEKGNFARGLLWSSGWIYNNDLLQFIEPSTFITKETNSIKNYKTLLLDFMNTTTQDYEFISFGKKAIKVLNGAVETTNDTVEAYYIKKIEECENIEEIEKILVEYLNKVEANVSNKKIKLNVKDFKNITKKLKYVGESFWVYSELCDNITSFILLEARLETIYKYEDFLQIIENGKNELPYGLVVAAKQLQEELVEPYISQAENVLVGIIDKYSGDIFNLDELIMGDTFSGAVKTIKLGALIVNLITDIGAVVKQSNYVEAYAYLGMYYSNLLYESKNQFIQSKTAKNAWEFYDTYQLLFQIRQKGELAYLKMSETGGIVEILCDAGGWDYFGISDKEAFIEERLKYMNDYCFFGIDNASNIDGSHYYVQKIVVECPVNIALYDKDNNLLYTLLDEVESNVENEFGRFVCKYDPISADYVKVIYLNNSLEYNVEIIGNESGKVSCSIVQVSNGGSNKIYGFKDLIIGENTIITANTKENQYSIDYEGDGKVDIEADYADKTKKYIQFDYQNGKDIVVRYVDEDGFIELPKEPLRVGYEFIGWYDDLNGQGKKYSEYSMVEDSVTLYASWRLEEEKENLIPPENSEIVNDENNLKNPNNEESMENDTIFESDNVIEDKVPKTGDSLNLSWVITGFVGINCLTYGLRRKYR